MHNKFYEVALAEVKLPSGDCPLCKQGLPPVQEQGGTAAGKMPPSPPSPQTPTDLAEQEEPRASSVAPPITPAPGQEQNARTTTTAPVTATAVSSSTRIDLQDTLLPNEFEGHVPDGDQQQRTTAVGLGDASEGSGGQPPQEKGADNEATQVDDPKAQLGDQTWVNGSCQPGGGQSSLDDDMDADKAEDKHAVVASISDNVDNAGDSQITTIPKMCCRCLRYFDPINLRNSNSKNTFKCKKCNSIDTVIGRYLSTLPPWATSNAPLLTQLLHGDTYYK